MDTSQNHTFKKLFIDYKPAEIQRGNNGDWRIVFYVKVPGKEKMKRFRRRIPSISSKTERNQYAKRMAASINEQLRKGWSPFYDGAAQNNMTLFENAIQKHLDQAERKCKDNLLREDSLRSYRSFSKNILQYLKEIGKEKMLCVEIDRSFIINFLDELYYKKKRTARTSNNYLSFISQMCVFMVDRNYISKNPTEKIEKRKVGKKKREVLPDYLREQIFKYQFQESRAYLTLCLCVYFYFIRRTEITKLQVKHISLERDTIFLPAEISKNRINGVVTIPKRLKSLLADHIKGSYENDYVFSSDNYKTGQKQVQPKKISDEWAKMRKALNFESKFQFYSLKDTGITNLLLQGVAAKKVRDQARHHDIRITEKYTPEKTEADQTLLNLDFDF